MSSDVEAPFTALELSAAAAQLLRSTPGLAQIVVWTADLHDVGLMAGRSVAVLSAAERSEACRRPAGRTRDAFAARRVLRRALVAAHLGCEPADVQIETRCPRCGDSRHGPPTVIAPSGDLHLSTSSVGDLLAVAVAPFPVGLDIERLDRLDERTALDADRATHGGWTAVERSISAVASPAHVWTALESLGKGLGTGLVATAADLEAELGRWSFRWWAPGPGSLGCVAAPRPIVAVSTMAAPTGPADRRA